MLLHLMSEVLRQHANLNYLYINISIEYVLGESPR